jgi:hypothetical protein
MVARLLLATIAAGGLLFIGDAFSPNNARQEPAGGELGICVRRKQTTVWGDNPKGLLIFLENGRYSSHLMRGDLPKFASGSRSQGTPEENKAIVHEELRASVPTPSMKRRRLSPSNGRQTHFRTLPVGIGGVHLQTGEHFDVARRMFAAVGERRLFLRGCRRHSVAPFRDRGRACSRAIAVEIISQSRLL